MYSSFALLMLLGIKITPCHQRPCWATKQGPVQGPCPLGVLMRWIIKFFLLSFTASSDCDCVQCAIRLGQACRQSLGNRNYNANKWASLCQALWWWHFMSVNVVHLMRKKSAESQMLVLRHSGLKEQKETIWKKRYHSREEVFAWRFPFLMRISLCGTVH